jgi:hypothetical protein
MDKNLINNIMLVSFKLIHLFLKHKHVNIKLFFNANTLSSTISLIEIKVSPFYMGPILKMVRPTWILSSKKVSVAYTPLMIPSYINLILLYFSCLYRHQQSSIVWLFQIGEAKTFSEYGFLHGNK